MVYVDYDPVVFAHARALLTSHEVGATGHLDADLRDTGAVLAQAAGLLDFTRPVAVTLVSVLHAIPDADDPRAIVAALLDAVPSGSYLTVSHLGTDLLDPERQRDLEGVTGRMSRQQMTWRDREQVERFFTGTDLVEPGLVRVERWRPPAGGAGRSSVWGAVGRKR